VKVLFLDDMEGRHKHAQEWFGPDVSIVPARTAPEFLGLYLLAQSSRQPFVLVSLDRDLGGQWTGEDVVDQILRLHSLHLAVAMELFRPEFAIHSWNIPGAERMANRLRWAGFDVARKPFSPPGYESALDEELLRRNPEVAP
jgi:hypothetical protein